MDHDRSPEMPVSFILQAREKTRQKSPGHVIKRKLYMQRNKKHSSDQGRQYALYSVPSVMFFFRSDVAECDADILLCKCLVHPREAYQQHHFRNKNYSGGALPLHTRLDFTRPYSVLRQHPVTVFGQTQRYPCRSIYHIMPFLCKLRKCKVFQGY